MDLNAVLCNHAESQNNLLYIAGGGIDRTFVQQGAPGPYAVHVAIGLSLGVPWTQTNQQHALQITLVDADGRSVDVPTGPDTFEPFEVNMQFNIGRPPTLEVGEEQKVNLAVNLPGLPIPTLGRYFFVISVDGTELRRLEYRVLTEPGLTMNSGPTGIPRLPQ